MRAVLLPPPGRPPPAPRGAVRLLTGAAMGTTWSARFVADELAEDAARAAIERELDLVVSQMSPWEPDSTLSRFNRAAPATWVAAPDAFRTVLAHALSIADITAGAFDPTVGGLVEAWGFGARPFRGAPPAEPEVSRSLGFVGWHRLRMDARGLLQPGGSVIDLCGIAKGYAVDRMARALADLGATAFLVELGGELRGEGVKPDGTPWWVELEADPRAAGPRPVAALSGLSVATSGGHRRNFSHEGRRYSHTLDPRCGRPAAETVLSVSVLHRSCMTADALATALIVMGAEVALAFAERRQVAAVLAVARPDGVELTMSTAACRMAASDG